MLMARPEFPVGWRTILKVLLLVALLVAGNFLAHAIVDTLDFQIRPSNEDMVHRTIMLAASVYTILLAIPFVPGAEIGLAMIALLGAQIAFLVYICTVTGLTLAFLCGRLIPLSRLVQLAEAAGLRRLPDLLRQIEPLPREEIPAFLAGRTSNRYLSMLLRYRYLALAVLLNVPANFVIGGGGGIALMAGISRIYSLQGALLAIAIAVAPVPLAVTIFGKAFLTG